MLKKLFLLFTFIFCLLFLSSCVEVAPPDVVYLDHAARNIDLEGFDAIFFFEATNPNPVGLNINSYTYKIFLNNEEFLSDTQQGFKIPASGKKNFEIKTRVKYSNIFNTVSSMLGTLLSGEKNIPYRIEGTLQGEVGNIKITAPIKAEGSIKVDIPKK